jgi:S-(hydroxymethyl)mycothiol dehydrogenase
LLGHEGSGIVEEVGDGVSNIKGGDYVVMAWRTPCRACRFCLVGQPHLCSSSLNAQQKMTTTDGKTLTPILGIGTFCTHTLVHAEQCVPVQQGLPPEQLSLLGCGVMTGVCAALYTGNVRPGQSVAVIGCGGVGDSVIMGAVNAGATTIIGVDVDPTKLEWAKGFGATHTVNPREEDAVGRIKEITGGNGVNVSFEVVGKLETLETALWCRDLAGICVMIGVHDQQSTLSLPVAQFYDRGGSLRVAWYGDCLPTRDIPLLSTWYAQGRLNLDSVVTRTYTIDESEDAFHAMERGETLRGVIRL